MSQVVQGDQPAYEPPQDPEIGRYESIKIVPFAKSLRVQVRTVRQEGEGEWEWVERTRRVYLRTCDAFQIEP